MVFGQLADTFLGAEDPPDSPPMDPQASPRSDPEPQVPAKSDLQTNVVSGGNNPYDP